MGSNKSNSCNGDVRSGISAIISYGQASYGPATMASKVSGILYLTAGQYVELYAESISGGNTVDIF